MQCVLSRAMRNCMRGWLLTRTSASSPNALVCAAAAGLQAQLPRPHEPDATEWLSGVVRLFLSLPDRCGGSIGGCGRVGDTDSLPPQLKCTSPPGPAAPVMATACLPCTGRQTPLISSPGCAPTMQRGVAI